MTVVLIFLGFIILFMGAFLFLMMKAVKTEQAYTSHLKTNYPAVYDDNPYSMGGALEYKVMRKRVLRYVIFTRAKSDEAKAEYALAKQDKVVQQLKRRAWAILIGMMFIIPVGFLLLLLIFFAPN